MLGLLESPSATLTKLCAVSLCLVMACRRAPSTSAPPGGHLPTSGVEVCSRPFVVTEKLERVTAIHEMAEFGGVADTLVITDAGQALIVGAKDASFVQTVRFHAPGAHSMPFARGKGRIGYIVDRLEGYLVLDDAGSLLWSWPTPAQGGLAPNCAVAADLDGDGSDELVIATARGLHALDGSGRSLWVHSKQKSHYHHVVVVGHTRGREIEILALRAPNYKGEVKVLEILSANGQLRKRIKLPTGFGLDFSAVQGPSSSSGEFRLVGWRGSKHIVVMDNFGKVIYEWEIPRHDSIYHLRATAVSLCGGELECIAVLAGFSRIKGRAALALFSPNGALLHFEELEGTDGMLALSNAHS